VTERTPPDEVDILVRSVAVYQYDVATASLIENWIDETERRTWFLSEIVRGL